MTEGEILADFPDLSGDDIRAVLPFAAAPAKVIWLDVVNAATAVIIELLQREQPRVLAFGEQPRSG